MKERPTTFALCSLLTLVTLLCYWPISRHDFVSFDDQEYVYENSHVTQGLTWSGVAWAFRTRHASNWHPLTWISHMLDCELYRLNPGGHHLTNLLFHLANTALLLLLLHQMTGTRWRSAFVAALFAWHPLHVESVAWASERKDVLSTFFWILTMMAYVRYARESKVQSLTTKSAGSAVGKRGWHSLPSNWYCMALVLFACGLMSKPMLVTLPCVLLLIDFWPLQRLRLEWFSRAKDTAATVVEADAPPGPPAANADRPAAHLVMEKLPFFALSLGSSIVTYLVQDAGGAVRSLQSIPLLSRIANAVLSYAGYISKACWPADLAAFYPYPGDLPVGRVMTTALLLALVTSLFVLLAKRQPYLIVGWLWYLGTLVPTIGLIQVGAQSMADRYMYIPSIGLFLVGVWGLNAISDPWRCKRQVLAVVGTIALTSCLACTWVQLGYWQNSEKLFRHAIRVTTDHYVACDALGIFLNDQGRTDEALALLSESLQMSPRFPKGNYDMGTVLLRMGRLDEAVRYLTAAVKYDPNYAHAHMNLGKALLEQGRLDEAATHLSKAVQLARDDPEAHYNLGTALLIQAKPDDAIACFSEALRLKPDHKEAHSNLGVVLMQQGRLGEGASHLSAALRLNPGNPEAHFNLGIALLELNHPREAAEKFTEALRLNPNAPGPHYHLAIALVRQDKPKEALPHAQKARDLALTAGQSALATKAEDLLKQLH